jgi:hypothetical protein
LRFLGIMVTSDGRFQPWRDSFDKLIFTIMARLREVGLGSTPTAIIRALFISVLPCVLYGCELWGLDQLYSVIFEGTSPFASRTLEPILHFLKGKLGVS